MTCTRRRSLSLLAAVGFVAAIATGSSAHDAEKGPNGGQMLTVKGHHVEFVANGTELTFHLSDEGHAPTPSKGAAGKAVILEGSKQSTVPLTAREPSQLIAILPAPLVAGARVVVSAKLGNGHDIVARFVSK